jgi:hypothetical protein
MNAMDPTECVSLVDGDAKGEADADHCPGQTGEEEPEDSDSGQIPFTEGRDASLLSPGRFPGHFTKATESHGTPVVTSALDRLDSEDFEIGNFVPHPCPTEREIAVIIGLERS